MISDKKRDELEEEYEMPVERLMFHLYHECDMSAGDIADELGEPHSTVKDWLRRSGIQLRTRRLSDIQRILIMAYFDAGFGDGSISHRVGCGRATVNRYRNQIEEEGRPTDLDSWVSSDDYELLMGIVDDVFGPPNGDEDETDQRG